MALQIFRRLWGARLPTDFTEFEEPIRAELFSVERLEQHAQSLAVAQTVTTHPSEKRALVQRVRGNGRVLHEAHKLIGNALRDYVAITPAAEWLLDNFHVVEDQLRDIREHLPAGYYRKLPKLAEGPLRGYPRVYGVAWAVVAHADSRFDPDWLIRFVRAYQRVQPLTIGELWAVPISLRIVMVENLRRLAVRIVGSQMARQAADRFVDELLPESDAQPSDLIEGAIGNLGSAALWPAFAVQLVQRLRYQAAGTTALLEWLNRVPATKDLSIDEIVQTQHADQAAANLTVRNLITSMRAVAAFDWRMFFEEVSLVDATLRQHPGFVAMDFTTRDRYRHAIEQLAQRSSCSELDVAAAAVAKTERVRTDARSSRGQTPGIGEIERGVESDPRLRDPGYYLIEAGRESLERELGCRIGLRERFRRAALSHATPVYLGAILFLTIAVAAVPLSATSEAGMTGAGLLLLGLLSLLPASDMAIALCNRAVTNVFGPRPLPRLALEDGIPASLRTMVVMPTMLGSVEEIAEHVERLETHYLSNRDGDVFFALLTDWRDADSETDPTDDELLAAATAGIDSLNTRYPADETGSPRFFLLHRARLWNPGERKWMGWERKRGKLHEFNRLLRGASDTSFLPLDGRAQRLPSGVRYVVTVDADTKLPIGAVRRLVGTAAHALNRPQWDNAARRVVRGHGVLQPRVTPAFPTRAAATIFQRVFSGPAGLDPYASAVSDVYQDLFGEGSYTGKGLYDVDIFEQSLAGRVPENAVLSHDLFEGIFARCGLVSDVEFFDDFPSSAQVAASRQHRWVRGDWQLLPWIFGRAERGISIISRWKMLDNLRRSLSPVACVLLLLASWSLLEAPQGVWTAFVLIAIAFPGLLSLLDGLGPRRRDVSLANHLRALGADLRHSFAHALISVITLAYQAWLMLDAITRTLTRVFISRRRMLDWVTAAQAGSNVNLSLASALWPPRIENIVITLGTALALWRNPGALPYAIPFLLLWWSAPVVMLGISLPPRQDAAEPLSPAQVARLRATARRIWLFFTTFVTAEDHALPPDNFQEKPEPVVAHRSSPTNFGLYLLSCIAARDFGWIGLRELADRIEATSDTLLLLPTFRGHFFNWYETRELRPLVPKYVSTVDSGNLAGHLLGVAQGCDEGSRQPLFAPIVLAGVGDALRLARAALREVPDDRRALIVNRSQLETVLEDAERLLTTVPLRFSDWVRLWDALARQAALLNDVATTFAGEHGDAAESETLLWATELQSNVKSFVRDVEPLVRVLASQRPAAKSLPTTDTKSAPQPLLLDVLDQHLRADSTLRDVAFSLPAILEDLRAGGTPEALINTVALWGATCTDDATRLDQLAMRARTLVAEMDFAFLFDANRQLFSIGYRVDETALDESYYDLLASEARLASFVAIAKGDVPSTHWFHLSRASTTFQRRAVLLSWSGSMFEYLMPSLVLDTPRGTLLDQTCRGVVARQIEYGDENGIPWGISESAYNQRDRALTYQYSDFGVPGLGLKRGLGDDLVVAPYATAMAGMYEASAAARNLAVLEAEGGQGRYGLYDAIDYTPDRLAEGQTAAVVHAYMAHHQGISLVALDNALSDGIMRRRFHSDPVVHAAELLLQERPPREVADHRPRLEHLPAAPVRDVARPATRQFDTPHTPIAATHLLSNGRYAVMLTAAGSGYSQWSKLCVTRWREDVTTDIWGSFLFLRDVDSGRLWSATYQPTAIEPHEYEVVFAEDRARISRRDGALTTVLEVIVSSEDDAEVRRLSITNNGSRHREIEITSYSEVVLAELAADMAHPAFSNLFVQTEYVPEVRGLLATRRARSAEDAPLWAAHVVTPDRASKGGIQYETDRARFLGRGRTVRAPAAVLDGHPLSNSVGPVLDPILSLRLRVSLPPGATSHTVFSTMVAASRDAVIDLADKYHDASTYERISTLAWTHAQVQLHHLGIETKDALLYQELANRVLFSDRAVRPSSDVLKQNTLSASGLWPHRISGDYPIVLLSIDAIEDRAIVTQLLRAHEYWQMKGLTVDLVILNDKTSSYFQDLQTLLEDMARSSRATIGQDAQGPTGRVFVLRSDLLGTDERTLLHTVARIVLNSNQGGLGEQILRLQRLNAPEDRPVRRRAASHGEITPAAELPALEFFNGLGGFAEDGREYMIIQGRRQHTPMPWINVIANPNFGFQVSETGAGYTWSVNSRENQLTAWSNDPVSDSPGEVFYVRDEESGELWTPTAAPIRIEHGSYVTRHGQGYSRFHLDYAGIKCDVLQFVSRDEPVKISRLTLANHSPRPRRLSVTAYVEWVLGTVRAKSAPYVITERDAATGAMFAFNPLNNEFGTRIAFADLGGRQTGFTCDRTEFLGRHGNLEEPAALTAEVALGKRSGAGFDPCCALQTVIELKPGQQTSVVFLLGQATDRDAARELVLRHRAADVDVLLADVVESWDQVLGKIQVETPDRSMDLMLNRWLQYQIIVCRLWARAAFYQAGGAYGFRDQLQDTMALTLTLPNATRAHLLRAAARQFLEGDVQHWWHPPTGRGVRTHCSDDLVWLPFATAHYVAVTGDAAVLDEKVAYLDGPLLEPAQHDAYFTPALAKHAGTLFEHCARALDRSLKVGVHGLPLMGSGDWNDGMNRVGHEGKGESVWLAWFLYATLQRFAALAEQHGASEHATRWRAHAAELQAAAESQAWDGAWYRRAYFDDGTPLGSAGNAECRIDSIAQSWAVLSGAADPARARRAMDEVDAYLVRPGDDLVLLFTPPFDKTAKDPGYIKGYLPGVRENGGQYAHAAMWCVMARAQLGDGERAAELLAMLNPVNRAANRVGVHAYKVEPYVVAGDIYAEPPHTRRGGWTWYTGAAGWMYRAGLESMLGLTKRGDVLHVAPCIPPGWSGYRILYRHGETDYEINVENPHGVARGVASIELDGEHLAFPEQGIALHDDAQVHRVKVVLGNVPVALEIDMPGDSPGMSSRS